MKNAHFRILVHANFRKICLEVNVYLALLFGTKICPECDYLVSGALKIE